MDSMLASSTYGKTNISTKETAALKGARISIPYGELYRPCRPQASTRQRTQETQRLASMLPQSNRLRLESDIKTLFARGKSVFGSWVGMKFWKNDLPVSRFAVVTGVKVSKKAVVRNRLKRQVRAIVQEVLPRVTPGYDVLLFMKPTGAEKSFDELKVQVLASLKKARIL